MFKKLALAASLVAIVAFAVVAPQVEAGLGADGCAKKGGSGCRATDITFSPEPNPTPPIPVCLQGVTLYELNATITCGVGFGDPVSGYVCPASSQPLSILLNGQWHTFAPASGHTWADAIADCQYLTYSVS